LVKGSGVSHRSPYGYDRFVPMFVRTLVPPAPAEASYPRGLQGEEILLGARIIAVADFFEAITAERHDREPMRREEAIALLKRDAGSTLAAWG
jgi:hypothetical protein